METLHPCHAFLAAHKIYAMWGLVYLYSGSCFVFLCVLAAVKDKFAEVAQDILL